VHDVFVATLKDDQKPLLGAQPTAQAPLGAVPAPVTP
jgi:hypothetical protein